MLDPDIAYIYNIILSIITGILFVLLINYFMNPSNTVVIDSNSNYKNKKKCF